MVVGGRLDKILQVVSNPVILWFDVWTRFFHRRGFWEHHLPEVTDHSKRIEGSMKVLYTCFCSCTKSHHANTLENFCIFQSYTKPYVNSQKKYSFCFSRSPNTDSFLLISLVILIKMLDCGYADCLMWSLVIMLITVFSQFFPICFIHLWILSVI